MLYQELHGVYRHVCSCVDERSGLVFTTKDIDLNARGVQKQLEDLGL